MLGRGRGGAINRIWRCQDGGRGAGNGGGIGV